MVTTMTTRGHYLQTVQALARLDALRSLDDATADTLARLARREEEASPATVRTPFAALGSSARIQRSR